MIGTKVELIPGPLRRLRRSSLRRADDRVTPLLEWLDTDPAAGPVVWLWRWRSPSPWRI